LSDWSKLSDKEVAEAYAETIKVVNKTKEELKIYESVKKDAEFQFLVRFNEETRKQWGFIIGK